MHVKCGHGRKYEKVPGGLCHSYNGEDGGRCRVMQVVHENHIVAPSLCVACFRQVENDICEQWNPNIRGINRQLLQLKKDYKEGQSPLTGEEFLDLCKEYEGEVVDLKIGRKVAIASFRSQQGVWADG